MLPIYEVEAKMYSLRNHLAIGVVMTRELFKHSLIFLLKDYLYFPIHLNASSLLSFNSEANASIFPYYL